MSRHCACLSTLYETIYLYFNQSLYLSIYLSMNLYYAPDFWRSVLSTSSFFGFWSILILVTQLVIYRTKYIMRITNTKHATTIEQQSTHISYTNNNNKQQHTCISPIPPPRPWRATAWLLPVAPRPTLELPMGMGMAMGTGMGMASIARPAMICSRTVSPSPADSSSSRSAARCKHCCPPAHSISSKPTNTNNSNTNNNKHTNTINNNISNCSSIHNTSNNCWLPNCSCICSSISTTSSSSSTSHRPAAWARPPLCIVHLPPLRIASTWSVRCICPWPQRTMHATRRCHCCIIMCMPSRQQRLQPVAAEEEEEAAAQAELEAEAALLHRPPQRPPRHQQHQRWHRVDPQRCSCRAVQRSRPATAPWLQYKHLHHSHRRPVTSNTIPRNAAPTPIWCATIRSPRRRVACVASRRSLWTHRRSTLPAIIHCQCAPVTSIRRWCSNWNRRQIV